jgi:hypothetical protein
MRALGGVVIVSCAALTGCAGARYEVAADHARYPISFSPSFPDETGKVIYLGHELESKGSFEFSTTQLGFLYGLTSAGTVDVSERINEEVAKKGGEGVVALVVKNQNCFTNYLFPLPILPFYPGCQIVTVTGTVVSLKGRQVAEAATPPANGQRGVTQ